jgi:hypothetical protein
VQSKAWVLNSPCGSRTSTQRMGTAGNPVLYLRYQSAVPEATSTLRSSPPYQLSTVAPAQAVLGSSATSARFGSPVCPSGAVFLSAQLCVAGRDHRARRPSVSE